MSEPGASGHRGIAALRAFARVRSSASEIAPSASIERCDLCSAPLGPGHDHLVDPKSRELRCSCIACALLFQPSGEARFQRVRHRAERLADFRMTDAEWAALHIPIALAFFFRTRDGGDDRVIALFPSPAGATEAWLEEDAWSALTLQNPILTELEPDVEALLVVRLGERRDTFRVSIDVGYALVGLLRSHWRGLSGGAFLWAEIDRFLASLERGAAHA